MTVTAVVPLKPTTRAKTRLGLDAPTRSRLAAAFAADLLAQCRACAAIDEVVFVGAAPPQRTVPEVGAPGSGPEIRVQGSVPEVSVPGFRSEISVSGFGPDAGVRVVADPGRGLNAALAAAAATVATGPADRVLALMGDLPCATVQDLADLVAAAEAAVARTGGPGAFVGDAAGTGTTCLYAAPQSFRPGFGPRSRARHRAAGYAELQGDGWRRLRRDVDSLPDLMDAVRLGVGPATAAAVRTILARRSAGEGWDGPRRDWWADPGQP